MSKFKNECDEYVQKLHPNQQRWLAVKKDWKENVYPKQLAELKAKVEQKKFHPDAEIRHSHYQWCWFHDGQCPCTPEEIMELESERLEDEFWSTIMVENGYGFLGSIDAEEVVGSALDRRMSEVP